MMNTVGVCHTFAKSAYEPAISSGGRSISNWRSSDMAASSVVSASLRAGSAPSGADSRRRRSVAPTSRANPLSRTTPSGV